MAKAYFSVEFKRDAVAPITERGYPVAEVSQHLGVSPHSHFLLKKWSARQVFRDSSKDADARQLKRPFFIPASGLQ